MKLAAGYGLVADEWQADPVCCIFARRKDGRWASATTKISVPRQNGKNGILEIVELFGMVVLGLKFLHTAHEVKTARKAFVRILSFFENERKHAELYVLAKEIRKTNGQEAIFLHALDCTDKGHNYKGCGCKGGGSIEFIARSSGSGRGFTVDVLVCDEDQDLTDDELAALLPTISAAPSGNPLVILTGTPPPLDRMHAPQGEVARRVRSDAIKKADPNLTCFDWGAPDGPMPDVDDEQLAYRFNPALGTRLNIDEVRRERRMMSAEKFAQERYGWWGNPDAKQGGVIDMSQWRGLRTAAGAPTRGEIVVDVSPDLTWTSVAVAADGPEGRTLVLVDRSEGTGWVLGRLTGLHEDLAEVVELALTPTAQIFAARLTKAKLEHVQLTNADVGRACAAFQESVRGGRIAHVSQTELDDAVRNATTRFREGGQVWDRRNPAIDISPLVATSVAAQRWQMHSARPKTPPPAPRRAQPAATRRPTNDIAHAGF